MKISFVIIILLALAFILFFTQKGQNQNNENGEVQKNENLENFYDTFLTNKLLEGLSEKYSALNFKIIDKKLVSVNGVCIDFKIARHNKFQSAESFQIDFLTTFKDYFKNGIEERLAGIGENDTSAITYGVLSFLNGQFQTIIEGISLKHLPDPTSDITSSDGKTHWHTIVGDIQLQGKLSNISDSLIYEKTFNLLKPQFFEKLKNSNERYHWLRYYISKNAKNEIIGDCYFDNNAFERGHIVLENYAESWTTENNYLGQKQFILFRKCDE